MRSAGLSYGGLNTMQALTRNSDVFAAGVANAPVTTVVGATRFDATTLRCDTGALEVTWREPNARYTVEVTIDGGAYWTKVDEFTTLVARSAALPRFASGGCADLIINTRARGAERAQRRRGASSRGECAGGRRCRRRRCSRSGSW